MEEEFLEKLRTVAEEKGYILKEDGFMYSLEKEDKELEFGITEFEETYHLVATTFDGEETLIKSREIVKALKMGWIEQERLDEEITALFWVVEKY